MELKGNKLEDISSQQKKLAILYGFFTLNELFPTGTGADDRPMKFDKAKEPFAGLTKKQLRNWQEGGAISAGTEKLSKSISEQYDLRSKKGKPISYDMIGGQMEVMEFGDCLGMRRSDCRYFVDQLYRLLLPSFTTLALDKEAGVNFTKSYGGLYIIYRLQKRPDGKWMVVQIPLSIRYLLRNGKDKTKSDYWIKCKLTVPRVPDSGDKIYEYDGLITKSNSAWYWVFEMRKGSLSITDMLFMTTNMPQRKANKTYMQGHMISSTHTNSEATHWPIVIVRDKTFKAKKNNRVDGLYYMQNSANMEEADSEAIFFAKHCKTVEYLNFEDDFILKLLTLDTL